MDEKRIDRIERIVEDNTKSINETNIQVAKLTINVGHMLKSQQKINDIVTKQIDDMELSSDKVKSTVRILSKESTDRKEKNTFWKSNGIRTIVSVFTLFALISVGLNWIIEYYAKPGL